MSTTLKAWQGQHENCYIKIDLDICENHFHVFVSRMYGFDTLDDAETMVHHLIREMRRYFHIRLQEVSEDEL